MAGIWIAASIATLVSVCGIGFLIAKTSAPDDRRFLTLVALLSLPMWFGLGFGVGEMWQAACWLSKNTELASTPWHQFGGFVIERFLVCLHHAAFTTAALRSIRQAPVRSILFAVSLHWLGNFPLFLKEINFGGLGADSWGSIVGIWMPLFSVGMIVLLGHFYAKSRKLSFRAVVNQIIGKAKCPECGMIYQRPLFGVNSGPFHRYERCPGCKKWHKTVRLKSGTESPEGDSTDMKEG